MCHMGTCMCIRRSWVCLTILYVNVHFIIEGSLEVKRPTTWTDGKAKVGRAREVKGRRKNVREEKERRERKKKEDQTWHDKRKSQNQSEESRCTCAKIERVEKSQNTVFLFQCFGAPAWWDERWKIARRCDAQQILKWKCQKHLIVGALLEVEM